MPEPAPFKSGKDIAEEPSFDDEETVACVDCGVVAPDAIAYENGWQFDPPVCPNCLRWCAVAADACCAGRLV